jgi:hypothetical protein
MEVTWDHISEWSRQRFITFMGKEGEGGIRKRGKREEGRGKREEGRKKTYHVHRVRLNFGVVGGQEAYYGL